jgi:hypothetical protein
MPNSCIVSYPLKTARSEQNKHHQVASASSLQNCIVTSTGSSLVVSPLTVKIKLL